MMELGNIGAGHFGAVVRSGDFTPLRASGVWTKERGAFEPLCGKPLERCSRLGESLHVRRAQGCSSRFDD